MTVERLVLEVLEQGVQLWVEDHDLCFKAPEGALTPALRTRLSELKAEVVSVLDADRRYAPASFDQRRLWILDQLQPGGSAYSTTGAFRLRGRLDFPALAASLREISRRHEALRTTLTTVDGRPVQVIVRASADRACPLPVVDLSRLLPDSRKGRASSLIAAQNRRAFNLTSEPLFRSLLVCLGGREWILFLRLHHAISDGWSEAILHRELSEHYASFSGRRSVTLPELTTQYADFAAWQRRLLCEETMGRLLDYWRGQLADLGALDLPTDRPRPDRSRFAGAAVPLTFDSELTGALNRIARETGATAYMTLLTVFMTLLQRLTDQRDFAVGSPITNRGREELEKLIGLFVNMLVMRADFSAAEDLRFSELLERVREMALEAYAHQDLPFDRLVAEQAPDRDLSLHPLFQVSFALHSTARTAITLPGLTVSPEQLEISTVQLDLELHLWETEAGLSGYLVYSSDLFDGSTIARWASHLEVLLHAVASEPRRRVQELPLHSRAQEHQLLAEWNDTRERYPEGTCLHQIFETQAARTPDCTAVVWRSDEAACVLSYRQLECQAELLARRLRGLDVGPETRVAIFLDRGPGRVVAMLGILKVSGAYLPLDPAYPARRLAYLVADSRTAVIVTSEKLRTRLPKHQARVVCLQPGGQLVVGRDRCGSGPAEHRAGREALSGNTAYVLYTSGSTGRPKGTAITHAAICNHMRWMQVAMPLDRRDRVLQKTPLSFDASVWEFWAPLQVGATLILSPPDTHRDPPELLRLAREQKATILQVVPTLLRVLLEEPSWNRCSSLRRVLCGGEALSGDLHRSFVTRSIGGELYNVYGPTEATIHATTHVCTPEVAYTPEVAASTNATAAIGRPIANAWTLIVDRRWRLVVPGTTGELMIGGAGLARGYLDRPRLTATRFVPDPFDTRSASRPGARLYRTGDLARHLAGGALVFVGRADHQVKVRGYRIEPGEVEALLLRHPAVRDAAVVLWSGTATSNRKAPPGGARLVAYVVMRSPGDRIALEPANGLRVFLAERLPTHMLPVAIIQLEALPLSPAGKVDRAVLARRALPTFERRHRSSDDQPPRTPVEELIAAIWTSLLGLERLGVHDNFFERGGHSLLAIQALARIRRSFGVEVAVRTMFEQPTIAGLAASLERIRLEQALGIGPDSGRDRASLEAPPIVPVRHDGELPLSYPQRGLWFLNQLEPASTAYHAPTAFHLTGCLHMTALETGLCELIRRHGVLRTTFASDGGRPRQRLGTVPAKVLSLIDLARLAPGRRSDAARRIASYEASRPFDLSLGPLFRARLLRLAEDEHVLLLSVHHIAFDGWSHGILCRELGVLYACFSRGEPSPLPELAVQYADFAVWQRRWLMGAALNQRLDYWREQLAGQPLLHLPGHRTRLVERTAHGAAARDLELERGLLDALNRLAVDRGASLYMALLAAFILLLYRLTGQRDVTVGSPVANRGREEIESLIGFFVNLLPLRVGIAGDEACSFARVLSTVRETALQAYAYQDLPFERLVEELAPDRGEGRHPLFQVTLALHNAPGNELDLPGVIARPIRLETEGARLDLELHFWQPQSDADTLQGRFIYDTDLFDAPTIDRWSSHFLELLRAAVEEPELPISWLPHTPSAERSAQDESADRRASLAAGWPRVEPRTPVEQAVAEIWAQVLGIERIGVEDNFFHLGGHSLLATQVISQVRLVFESELPLRVLFERPTVAGLAKWLAEAPAIPTSLNALPITAASRDREPRLSFAQQRLWFLQQLAPESPAYSMFDAQCITGRLDVTALARALGEIVHRHEVLRTVFPSRDGHPRQRVLPAASFRLARIDLDDLPGEQGHAEARRQLLAEAARPFDLARDASLRAVLIRLAKEDHVLFLNRHHIVYDGWSHGIFSRELSQLYGAFVARGGIGNASIRGQSQTLPRLAVQYADFAIWQRDWLRGEMFEDHFAYWRRQLHGLPVLELVSDRPRTRAGGRTHRGASAEFRLSTGLTRKLKRLSQEAGVSLYMTLLAAFMTFLHRLTGQDEIVLGTPIANRRRHEIENLIGFFVNTLVLRGDLSTGRAAGRPNFHRLLSRVRTLCLGAFEHQDLPFEKLVQTLDPERDLARSPLFQVMFTMQNAPSTGLHLAGVEISPFCLEIGDVQFDLTVDVTEVGEQILGHLVYDTELFDRTTQIRWARQYVTLLGGIVEQPTRSLARMPLLAAGGRHQLLTEWNDTAAKIPLDKLLHQLFEDQVVRTPERIALNWEESARTGTLSYRSLNWQANRLARRLRSLGVEPETRVSIFLDQGPKMVVAMLGILKAGGAYVPLDPGHPPSHLAYVVEDSAAAVIVTRRSLLSRLPPHRAETVTVASRDAWPMATDDDQNPATGVAGDNTAYVLYTSGSSGRPKGVAISHANITNHMQWMQAELLFSIDDRLLQKTPFSFDASIWEFWAPFQVGARLTLANPGAHRDPSGLVHTIQEQRVTTLQVVPSLLRVLVAQPDFDQCRSLRRVLCGGEALSMELRNRFATGGLAAELYNVYGPTEATIHTSISPCRLAAPGAVVAIGRPIANTRVYLLDRHLRPVPTGAAGELHIAGVSVGRGYSGLRGLTGGRFLPNPFGGLPGERMYRSGDLARHLVDGNIEFLGRTDFQLKIRGFRVEPGEIEAHLRQHPKVRDAVVVARQPLDVEAESASQRLLAYVVASSDAAVGEEGNANDQQPGEPTHRELRTFLAERLPEHMVPAVFVSLNELPLSASGKVDRAKLRLRPLLARERLMSGSIQTAPRTPIEQLLVEIWGSLLELDNVGVHDNFFALGGHSLLATQVVSRIRRSLGAELSLRILFERPTIAELAVGLEKTLEIGEGLETPPITFAGRDRLLPLSFAQQRLWFLQQLAPESPVYNMPVARRIEGRLDLSALTRALAEIGRRHEILRTTFPATSGHPHQHITASRAGSQSQLPLVDLTWLLEAKRQNETRRRLSAEARRPFELAREVPLRAALVRLGTLDHVLFLNLHHIASDGWSHGIFNRELSRLYQHFTAGSTTLGTAAPLPELRIQYADFAIWQHEWLAGGVLAAQLAYWRRQLQALPTLELPTDSPRPAVRTYRGAAVELLLPIELTSALKNRSLEAGVSLYMFLLAAFMVLLHRLTGQPEIVVGTPIASRHRQEIEDLIGFFVNTLVLRGNLYGHPSFLELLGRVKKLCLEAYDHQDVPFEKLVEEINPERDQARSPLFQVMFILQNAPSTPLESRELAISPFGLKSPGTQLDLTVSFLESNGLISGELRYNTDLFKRTTISRLARRFTTLLAGVTDDPICRVNDLTLLTAAERHQSIVEWNEAGGPPATGKCLHQLFAAQAGQTPDAIAVAIEDLRISFRELEVRARQLARRLRHLGVGMGDRVGLLLDRSVEAIVGLLAIHKAGGAYVPLEVESPPDRLGFLLEDSRATVLLTRRPLPSVLRVDHLQIVFLEPGGRSPAARSPVAPAPTTPSPATPLPAIDRRDIVNSHYTAAYVIYTSGSSGRPKGVVVEHRQITSYILAMVTRLALESGRGFALLQPLSVDSSMTTVFGSLLTGGCLHILSRLDALDARVLAELIERLRIDVLKIAPSHLAALEDMAGSLVTVPRCELIIGGEAWDADRAARWRRHAPCRIWNHYGPTEATVGTHIYRVAEDPSRILPIGRPLPNSEGYVVDAQLQPAPVGISGELLLGGECLARGYLGAPALTARSFVPHPFAASVGRRLYKTGDLVRHRPDGKVEFLGRRDQQLKIRGFRIEPGEIEALLRGHQKVSDAAVLAWAQHGGEPRLHAFVVLQTPGRQSPDFGGAELRAFLRTRLPAVMVPSTFEILDALPRLPHGKIDRGALPVPSDSHNVHPEGKTSPERQSRFVPPRTLMEQALATIWEQVLNVESVGVHDDFFELGGHSLLVPKLLLQLHEATGVLLPVSALFQASNLADLAVMIEAAEYGEVTAAENNPFDLTADLKLDVNIRAQRSRTLAAGASDAVFLTGATGFLGAFLLDELLRQEDSVVYCLVRAGDGAEGLRRLRSALRQYGIRRPELDTRIVAVSGDLSRPLMGLPETDFDELAAKVGAIYHCGAWVNFTYPYEELRPSNVSGTEETLRLAARGRTKPYHFISTASVVAAAEPNEECIFREDIVGDRVECLGSGYVQTKWVAEKLLGLATARGIPATVYRPSLIGGHSRTGVGNTRDMIWSLIKGSIQMQAIAPAGRELNMAPVDFVSRAIVYLSRRETSPGEIFHLSNPESSTWDDALDVLVAMGYPLQRLTYSRWRRRLLAELRNGSVNALLPFLSQFLEERGHDERLPERSMRIDTRKTSSALHGSGIECPPLSAELFRRYVEYLIVHGFLTAPEP